jgi:ABC-type oligopeptide transport system substrate-binding subunit
VSEINVRDDHTVEFKLHEARPQDFMLGAFASGWNVIVRKKTLEEHNYNLRQVMAYPGTGPFRHKKRLDKEVWIMERNPDYWNEGLPYLDGIEFYNFLAPLSWGRRFRAAYRLRSSSRPREPPQGQIHPGMSGTDFYQSAIHAVAVNNTKKPFDDPRVRRALLGVQSVRVLVETVKDVAPMLNGGFVYPFSDFATPTAQLAEQPGYQADPTAAIKARQLMAAAGPCHRPQGVDFLVRESHPNKIWAAAIEAMLKEALHIDTTPRTVPTAVCSRTLRRAALT